MGYNTRLDSVQAIVGNWLIPHAYDITSKRIANAHYYDEHLSKLPQIPIPPRPPDMRVVYHLYIVFARPGTRCSSIASNAASRPRSTTRSRSIGSRHWTIWVTARGISRWPTGTRARSSLSPAISTSRARK